MTVTTRPAGLTGRDDLQRPAPVRPAGVPAPAPLDCLDWLTRSARPSTTVPSVPVPPRSANAGAGRRIALLDGGVDTQHPDLAGARVRVWSGGPDTVDDHATGLASLVVGQGAAHVRGLLPAAELLVAAVRPDREGGDAVVARAVRWAVNHGAEVIVLPFGRQRLGRRITTTLHEAMASGVRVFAAAGNLGPEVLAFPAAVTGVVAVTGHDGQRVLAQCCERADLAAPGYDVPAAGPRRRAYLQGCGPAAVLAAASHLAWVDAGSRPEARERDGLLGG
ncbi:S8 family serine peptidase [Actinotalea sp. M2MS4P-6]|uniref:S8 family serine peptidase n=1 Tax=Actinotalea sp. M2MS4P-6 TaxID=2983762 RepID=UPI0021E50CF9|nr:S8 family serine peptidase [Actinotalea sp. M2MS4P-6]MCV2395579.1 S8 family serine peptidase [Actinotalea sp. M2MS4P-6]